MVSQRHISFSSCRHLLLLSLFTSTVTATITTYGQIPLAQATLSAGAASSTATLPNGTYIGLAAYNPTVLQPPPPPAPSEFPTQVTLQLTQAPMPNASIQLPADFFGFSVEMSVANQVFGKNASFLQVPFLNLMANLAQRSGRINIRVGGNTQETATLVDNTPDGRIIEKDLAGVSNPTQTPPLVFTPELLYMLRNISSHINIRWHLGVPFNDTSNFRLAIAEQGQAILGDYLIGLQVGNEPDLYAAHGHRPDTYVPQDYFNEFGQMINAMKADSTLGSRALTLLIGPSVQIEWTPEQVWDTGFIDAYTENLAFLSVERYPSDNCAVAFPGTGGTVHDPQQTFPSYLRHSISTNELVQYAFSTSLAQQKGKPFLMFETNSASCGGFPGISDSFGAALWGVDYAMAMAASNFSGALFHVGGQSVVYNPFTPPPTNESTFHAWTVGPIYYSSLVVAEAIGPSNTSQVIDLTIPSTANNFNGLSDQSPMYAIWEGGALKRVLIVNFVSDPSGTSNLNVTLTLDQPLFGASNPSVQVKYLQAPSVSQKGNYTWANQTFGGNFESDGRPIGGEVVNTVQCTSATTCVIPVPAPAAALVFLPGTDGSGNTDTNEGAEAGTRAGPVETFSTTAVTRLRNTATIDAHVLSTSNGGLIGNQKGDIGSTSAGALKNGVKSTRLVGGDLVRRIWGTVLSAAVAVGPWMLI